jgi:hypothetical protein
MSSPMKTGAAGHRPDAGGSGDRACAGLGIRVFSLAASAQGARMYASLGFVPDADEMILRRR